jgi:hypothetical protein
MKIRISLPHSDIEFLDAVGADRSAVIHEAITALRQTQLTQQYADAFAEWADSEDARLWNATNSRKELDGMLVRLVTFSCP